MFERIQTSIFKYSHIFYEGANYCCLFVSLSRALTVQLLMGGLTSGCVQEEFSHPVESLALTVDEVINVRRVLVKAEMEKFLQSKELYNNLKKGKVTEWNVHVCSSSVRAVDRK